jgi:endonuclease III
MKEVKNFAGRVQQVFRSLKRKYPKPDCPDYKEPAEAIVFAVLCEHTTEQQGQTAMKRVSEHFIDLNDLRVSRPEEIIEVAGPDTGISNQTAANLTVVLKAIFEKYNMITLADIKKLGKKQIRETISQLPAASAFVIDYCMLTAFGAHAIPLTEKMVDYLKAEKIAEQGAEPQQVSQTLARQIPANQAYIFYALMRKEAEKISAKRAAKNESAGSESTGKKSKHKKEKTKKLRKDPQRK